MTKVFGKDIVKKFADHEKILFIFSKSVRTACTFELETL